MHFVGLYYTVIVQCTVQRHKKSTEIVFKRIKNKQQNDSLNNHPTNVTVLYTISFSFLIPFLNPRWNWKC